MKSRNTQNLTRLTLGFLAAAFNANAALAVEVKDVKVDCYLNDLQPMQGGSNLVIINPESDKPRIYFTSYSNPDFQGEHPLTGTVYVNKRNYKKGSALSQNYINYQALAPELKNYLTPSSVVSINYYPLSSTQGFIVLTGVAGDEPTAEDDSEAANSIEVRILGECSID